MNSKIYKHHVDGETLIQADGGRTPIAVWRNGRRFEIDKILNIRQIFSEAGGCGIKYTCRFGNQERNLFWERDRWFMESKRTH